MARAAVDDVPPFPRLEVVVAVLAEQVVAGVAREDAVIARTAVDGTAGGADTDHVIAPDPG